MAFIRTKIEGNTSFGGYLFMDSGRSVAIQDEMTYEIPSGTHYFEIHSKSDAERGMGKFQKGINGMTSNGKIIDKLCDMQANNSLGDAWSFNAELEDNDCLVIQIRSKGTKIVGEPDYEIIELDDETVAQLKEEFEAIRNTPRRNKKQIGWGLGLMFVFAFGGINMISAGETMDAASLGVMIVGFGIGVLLFVLGMKKKVRR